MSAPDGSDPSLIGDTARVRGATESTGIFDVSHFVGYLPGSIVLTNNQGSGSSLTVLINPDATLVVPEPTSLALLIAASLLLTRIRPYTIR